MSKNNKDGYITGNKNLIKVFEYALNQEETGKTFFEYSLKRMEIGAAVSAFKRLIKEEEKHIVFIEEILNTLEQRDKIDLSNLNDMVLKPIDYFDTRAKSEFLQQCVEGSMIPDVTVFNTAWLIERDLCEFYERMAENTEGELGGALLMLSRWEKSHEKFFKEYRDKLSDTYSKMPWGG